MTEEEPQQVIDELQQVIGETRHTLERFEATGMDEAMTTDYDKLLAILDDAVTQQRAQSLAMLDT